MSALDPAAVHSMTAPVQVSRASKVLRKAWKNRNLVIGGLIVGCILLIAVFANWLAPYSPYHPNYGTLLQGFGAKHWLGTDELGRDVLSRIMYGTRTSMEVSIGSVLLAVVVGVPIGLVSGFYGGFLDDWIVMRVMDALQSFPFLILALVLATMLGPGTGNAMIAIGIGYIPSFVRIVRGQVISEAKKDYVMSAIAIGSGDWRIMMRHILPNVLSPLIVQGSLAMASGIVAEASLSYLGLGAQPPIASWGSMLKTGQGYMAMDPWLSVVPGLAIVVAVLGFNLLGDGLRDFLDPRLKR